MLFKTSKGKVINLQEVTLVSISTIPIDRRNVDRAIVVCGRDVELWGAEVLEFQKVYSEWVYNKKGGVI